MPCAVKAQVALDSSGRTRTAPGGEPGRAGLISVAPAATLLTAVVLLSTRVAACDRAGRRRGRRRHGTPVPTPMTLSDATLPPWAHHLCPRSKTGSIWRDLEPDYVGKVPPMSMYSTWFYGGRRGEPGCARSTSWTGRRSGWDPCSMVTTAHERRAGMGYGGADWQRDAGVGAGQQPEHVTEFTERGWIEQATDCIS